MVSQVQAQELDPETLRAIEVAAQAEQAEHQMAMMQAGHANQQPPPDLAQLQQMQL